MSKNLNTVTSFVDNGESGTDGVLREKAGTNHDVEDMRRLGKEQLFRVGCHSIPFIVKESCVDFSTIAQFWLHVHFRICHDLDGNLADAPGVRISLAHTTLRIRTDLIPVPQHSALATEARLD
jgi:hypothetical protein